MKKAVTLALFGSFLVANPAITQIMDDTDPLSRVMRECAKEEDNEKRLSCFDDAVTQIVLKDNSEGEQQDAIETNNWQTETDIDPLTDEPIHYTMNLSETKHGMLGRPVALIVRCQKNKTELYINWDSFLGRDGVSVTYRVDKETAKTSQWSVSTGHEATFFPGSPIPLLKQISEAESFVASVTPYRDAPITAVFDISGAAEALVDIRRDCNW